MSDLTLDVSELKDLARDVRRVSPALAKEFLKDLGRSGEIVAQKARSNASFSTRIPGTVKVRRRGVSVRVQAGGDKAPHAAAFEHGGKTGQFRHPVFGDRNTWASQPAHPFLRPAFEDQLVPLERSIIGDVDATFARFGFHG